MALPWVSEGDPSYGGRSLWDVAIIGEDTWPGVPTVTCTVARSVDVQKSDGSDGATLKDKGYEPAKVTVVFRFWTAAQWGEAQRLLPKIHPRTKGGIRTPVDFLHPATLMVGVRQVYITEISAPETDGQGVVTLSMQAVEWFPAPKPAKSNVKKAKSSGGQIPGANSVNGPANQSNVDSNA